MAPKIPTELAVAREEKEQAYDRLEKAREAGKDEVTIELYETSCKAWTRTEQDWYDRWQAVGGTSDIFSILEAEQSKKQKEWEAECQAVIDDLNDLMDTQESALDRGIQ